METKLYKFSGAGNDFVVIDGRGTDVSSFREVARIEALCKEFKTDGLMILGQEMPGQAGHDVMADPDRPSLCFEVDEFHGENEGLVMAEIELESQDEAFERPSWLGEEVTGDPRFYNGYLARNPFKNW